MFDSIKKLFKKEKPKKYAVSALVENTVVKDSPNVSPLLSERASYIKYVGRLKQALVSGNTNEERFIGKYLSSKGLPVPKTLSECDKLIMEIELWD